MCVAFPLVYRLANLTSSSFSLEEAEKKCEQAVEKVRVQFIHCSHRLTTNGHIIMHVQLLSCINLYRDLV